MSDIEIKIEGDERVGKRFVQREKRGSKVKRGEWDA